MRTTAAACAVTTIVFVLSGTAIGEVTNTQISAAIERGMALLEKQQQPDGRWREYESEPGGCTALCTLALLRCGRTPSDQSIKKALAYLEKLPDPERTYASSLMIMTFAEADPGKYAMTILKFVTGPTDRQMRDDRTKGGWSYKGPHEGSADNSNTHFAMMAMHEAEKIGIVIPDQRWQLALNYWTQARMQTASGGFGYGLNQQNATGSMTCAAVDSLLLARDRLQPAEVLIVDDRIQCCGSQSSDVVVRNAVQWLGDRFTVSRNPNHASSAWLLYYLYGLERLGHVSGQRFFTSLRSADGRGPALHVPQPHDWYREGCESLLKTQDKLQGSWVGVGSGEGHPDLGTAFALLFLAHGRQPVVIGRMQHQASALQPADWNHHRRAVPNLVEQIGRLWGRDVAWQTVDFSRWPIKGREATLLTTADLLEFPVLFLSGSQQLDFDAEQRRILKEYVEQGGFLLAEACGDENTSAAPFDRSFRALIGDLFPGREMAKLPPEHAIWHAQKSVDLARLPKDLELWSLDVCCGTSVVYCPRSLSCFWELAGRPADEKLSQTVSMQIEQVTRLGCNLLAFATRRELKERLDRPLIEAKNPNGQARLGSLVVPILRHEGGADEAPTALNHLLRVVEWRLAAPVDYQARLISATELSPVKHRVVFMQGRRAFHFSDNEREALRKYVDGGGFLFAVSILSSSEFAASVRDELKALYPSAEMTAVAADHPIFSDSFSGFPLSTVTLSQPQKRAEDQPLATERVEITPVLEGLTIDGRVIAVLSPFDISCSLVRGGSLEYETYAPVDAARLGANVLLYGLQQRSRLR